MTIDVQKAMDHPKWGARNNPKAEMNMQEMLGFARKQDWPVFHVQDCSSDPESPYCSGQPLHDFKDEVKPLISEMVIQKNTQDAFCNTQLIQGMNAVSPSYLIVMGVHTQYCVSATVQSAISKGFNVVVLSDATVATAMDGLSAEDIQTHSLKMLENYGVKIRTCREYLS